jgi:hypothetical protein
MHRSETSNAPSGINRRLWVNWRWYRMLATGSVPDPKRKSRSGTMPATKPIKPALRGNFFAKIAWDAAAPRRPCVKVSTISHLEVDEGKNG